MKVITVEPHPCRRERKRTEHPRFRGSRALLFGAATLLAQGAWADTLVTAPDGRRVLLKDDGTWSDQQEDAKGDADAAPKPGVEAVLRLERKVDIGSGCRVVLSLQNQLGYEILSLVPYLAAYRSESVVFETVSVAFLSMRPGGVQERSADFSGIACADIQRIQVTGGERCEMGDLNKFSNAKGQCLARVRVVASDLIRFEK